MGIIERIGQRVGWQLVPTVEVTMADYLNTGDDLVEIGRRTEHVDLTNLPS